MGKLVKYCGDCEEGFAERFGFCPNCGGELEAFELNPVVKATETAAIPVVENSGASNFVKAEESAPIAETAFVSDTMDLSGDDILELDSVDTREAVVENVENVEKIEKIEHIEKQPETLAATVAAVSDDANDYQNYQPKNVSDSLNFYKPDADLDEYHVTVVSEQASSWFKPFLLSLMALAFLMAIGSYAIAIWIHGFQIPQIAGNDDLYISLSDESPLRIEETEKKNKEEGGGGGGGGNENPDPASKGRMPTNGKPTPLMIVERGESDIKIYNRIENNINREDNGDVIGGGTADGRSSGSGKGKGIGTGLGTGVGSGNGTGEGRGTGSGSGNGLGTGNGNGIGIGDQDNEKEDIPKIVAKKVEKPAGVTKGVSILSKPRANYTDAARQNNVQGTISLRVVFNANGTIGSVSPVNSLPYGLTEKAIAAAKSITFEPATKNGQPYAITKVVQYTFTIY